MGEYKGPNRKGEPVIPYSPTEDRPLSRQWRLVLYHLEHGGELQRYLCLDRRNPRIKVPAADPDAFYFVLRVAKDVPRGRGVHARDRRVRKSTVGALVEAGMLKPSVLYRKADHLRQWKRGEPMPPFAGEPITRDDFEDRSVVQHLLSTTNTGGYTGRPDSDPTFRRRSLRRQLADLRAEA